uniref:Uncharacterized protein n=1 Tax=Anopheles merus TaxID=30066 RepID=A0A182UX97_ANOME
MYTIREETFELVKEVVLSEEDPSACGALVPSKLTSHIVWKDHRMVDSVNEMLAELRLTDDLSKLLFAHSAASGATFAPELSPTDSDGSSSYSLFSSGSSELDNENMRMVWNELASDDAQQDGCEFCTIEPSDRQFYVKHQTYVNGKLCCPVLTAWEMLYLLAIAIPLLVPGRNIYLSHNFEANYGVPSNETQYFLWYQRFKDSGFNITKAIATNRRRRSSATQQPGLSRRYFYDQLEERMQLYGFNATGCMERLICEMSELPLHEHNGVFGDVLSVILRPSSSVREPLPVSYYEAETRGAIEGCHRYRAFCHTDLLGLASIVL